MQLFADEETRTKSEQASQDHVGYSVTVGWVGAPPKQPFRCSFSVPKRTYNFVKTTQDLNSKLVIVSLPDDEKSGFVPMLVSRLAHG